MIRNSPIELTPDHVARAVMMVFGKMADTRPFWCFLAVKPSCRQEVLRRVADKTLDLPRFEEEGLGEIIVSGESAVPPNEVVKTVAAMFSIPIRQLFADIDMDAEIAKEIERLKKEMGVA